MTGARTVCRVLVGLAMASVGLVHAKDSGADEGFLANPPALPEFCQGEVAIFESLRDLSCSAHLRAHPRLSCVVLHTFAGS